MENTQNTQTTEVSGAVQPQQGVQGTQPTAPVQGEPNPFANLIENFAQATQPQQPQMPQTPQTQQMPQGQGLSEVDWIRSQLSAQQQAPQAPQTPQMQTQQDVLNSLQAQMAQNAQVQQMAAALRSIADQQNQAQLNADITALKEKFPTFDDKAVANKLVELEKMNPALAQSLDNRAGWEMLHLAYFANVQPKADPIISGAQGNAPQSNADLVKSLEMGDNSNLEQIGKLF